MKSVRIGRTHIRTRNILLSVLIVIVGVIFEYVDEMMLSEHTHPGPDVFPPYITYWDAVLLLHINPILLTPALNFFFSSVTHLGSTLSLVIFCVLLYLFGYRKEAFLIFVTIILGTLAVSPLKATVTRLRPYSTLPVVPLDYEAGSSFPSGHSERIFAMATVLGRWGRTKSLLLYSLAVTVAFSRVYIGVHYPTDVLVGSLMGLIVGRITLRLERIVVGFASKFIDFHG
ncbi:phosphatase PAP2 family protein [Candidatus Bathyarchaeota archaeon]|nr:phosphatase PAP2 family protein [Candidatus Bathyarchaeota archaeon]MBS7629908.1 phosphatase PAP2 family protein [Candidatus Bathyarchaeota archaeon]